MFPDTAHDIAGDADIESSVPPAGEDVYTRLFHAEIVTHSSRRMDPRLRGGDGNGARAAPRLRDEHFLLLRQRCHLI